ncbi:MAG: response regulator, partial [Bacteroidia bacterium]
IKAHLCHTIAAAKAYLQTAPNIDIVCLDYTLADGFGSSLSQHIRQIPQYAHTPLVMLSDQTSIPPQDIKAQHFAWIPKPIRRSQILRICQSLWGGAVPDALPEQIASQNALLNPSLRILLTEDNRVNQKVALRMLGKIGYQADVANNGLEAIEAIQRIRYDLIFMDVQMPEMDGLTATREIHRMYGGLAERPVIVAMTANAMKEDRERCIEAGMDDYISKPVRLAVLKERLAYWEAQKQKQLVL